MKTNVLLIAKQASESNEVIREAVARSGRTLRQVANSEATFALLRNGLIDVDLVIVDLDPGIHSMVALEALDALANPPPIIALTGFEEDAVTPIAHRHGADACIAKPFTADELARLIGEVTAATHTSNCWRCDLWGHPHRDRLHLTRKCAR